jgi:hypothetical protein
MQDQLFYWQPAPATKSQTRRADVCVYGGSAAGIIAAVQAARLGLTVLVLNPARHIGGLTTGGLSWTDFGRKEAIGGLSREFYRRVGAKYRVAEEWAFEPHVAEEVLWEMVREVGVPILQNQFLATVKKQERRIVAITTEAGVTVHATVFIDCTYEGDLMAKAGVQFHVGREANRVYTETINGVQRRNTHQFTLPVSPYVVESDVKSGLLPGIQPTMGATGAGDKSVQAYCFRLTLTKTPDNRLAYEKPDGYDPRDYELLARYLKAGFTDLFSKFDPLRGGKFDKNNHGGFSTDFIGANHAYPNASYAERERIFQAHVRYQKGLMYFLGNDKQVPDRLQARWREWGLCKDEFTDTGGWSRQLYVREARRMIASVVMTENHCVGKVTVEDSVGLGSYNMDSHNCNRVVIDGKVQNEGDVQVKTPPYPISYRAIVPERRQCTNLFVPVCLSCSHIAYGSIRMEPVFMILGQSAALAAKIAVANGLPTVQDVPYSELAEALRDAGQVL